MSQIFTESLEKNTGTENVDSRYARCAKSKSTKAQNLLATATHTRKTHIQKMEECAACTRAAVLFPKFPSLQICPTKHQKLIAPKSDPNRVDGRFQTFSERNRPDVSQKRSDIHSGIFPYKLPTSSGTSQISETTTGYHWISLETTKVNCSWSTLSSSPAILMHSTAPLVVAATRLQLGFISGTAQAAFFEVPLQSLNTACAITIFVRHLDSELKV